MRTLINIVLVLGLALIVLALGFRLGVDFVQIDITSDIVKRDCVFYQNPLKEKLAFIICSDGSWWNANPYFFLWDRPL
jgi:hypothetical protein